MQNKITTITLWVLMIVFDLLIVYGVCEAWTRYFIPVTNMSYYHSQQLGDMLTPNQRTYGYVEGKYSNIFLTNSYGFHDIERNIQKDDNTYRIQIYGDSLVAGAGVQIKDTIPSLIETYLNTEKQNNVTYEVLNMASGEDSTSAEFLVYQKIGKQFNPDLVICYFMADFTDNIFETHHRTRSPYHKIGEDGRLEFVPPAPVDLNTPWERFKRTSMLYRLFANKLLSSKSYNDIKASISKVLYRISSSTSSAPQSKTTKPTKSYAEKRKEVLRTKSWPITLKIIVNFRDLVEKNGGRFILLHGRTLTEGNTGGYTNNDFIQFLKKNNIEYITAYELYEEIRYHRAPEEDLFFKDSHPKAAGNKILSRYIASELQNHLQQNPQIHTK